MTAIDFEAQYNNRQRVPEYPQIAARWSKASAAVRAEVPYLELAYGSGERERYDLFRTPKRGYATPLVVYVHGGYWQRGHRKDCSFIAPAFLARGIDVLIPSYDLCPAVSVLDIVEQLKRCLVVAWRRHGQRPIVVGHSAGGHIAASLLATDWSSAATVPDDLVRAAYSISGVFELEPLIPTSLNDALRLTPEAARASSPLLWQPPPLGRTLVAAVGGDESAEFLRQSLAIASSWSAASVKAECVVVPGTNHFTIVDELARPESAMFARVCSLARG